MAPKCAEVPSSVSKQKKAVMWFTEICVLDQLPSGMSYSAVGQGFNVNHSTICIKTRCVQTPTQEIRLCVDWLTKML